MFQMDVFVNMANSRARHKFDWEGALQLMIAERLNEPCSKLQSFSNQNEYIGFSTQTGLQHFYRTLDILNKEQDALKAIQKTERHIKHRQYWDYWLTK